MVENIIDKTSQNEINFMKTQAEKSFYLGEYKENVVMALTIDQINSGLVYEEIMLEMKKPTTASVKFRRDIPLKNLKPYIREAEKLGIRYILEDALDFVGNIGLVVVSKEAFDNNNREIVVEDIAIKFEKAGLYPEYIKYFGKKLCAKHYDMVAHKMPEYLKKYEKLNFIDTLFGSNCPICRVEREKNK